jgi:hypothetical protein
VDIKAAAMLGVCIILAALVLGLVPHALTRTDAGEAALSLRRIHSPGGSLVLDYMVETLPTTAEGGQIQNVSDIEFHEGYVVVKDKAGNGRVFFGSRTRSLNWSEGKR